VTDTSRVGVVAAELMQDIAEKHGGDVEIGTVMVIVALESDDSWGIETRCSDQRDWVKLGLVESVAAELRKYVSNGEHHDGEDG
jgi:hypothetical protein